MDRHPIVPTSMALTSNFIVRREAQGEALANARLRHLLSHLGEDPDQITWPSHQTVVTATRSTSNQSNLLLKQVDGGGLWSC